MAYDNKRFLKRRQRLAMAAKQILEALYAEQENYGNPMIESWFKAKDDMCLEFPGKKNGGKPYALDLCEQDLLVKSRRKRRKE